MAYHEYMTRSGRVVRRRYNPTGKLSTVAELRTEDAIQDMPDSLWYQERADEAIVRLNEILGALEYQAWFWRTFEQDGKTILDWTWKDIMTAARLEIEHPSECTCTSPDKSCSVCRSIAHIVYQGAE